MATHTLKFTFAVDLTGETSVGQQFMSSPHRAGDFLFILEVYPKGVEDSDSVHAYLTVAPVVSSSLDWSVVLTTVSIGIKDTCGGTSQEATNPESLTLSMDNPSLRWRIPSDEVWVDASEYWHGNSLVFEATVEGNFASTETCTALQSAQLWVSPQAGASDLELELKCTPLQFKQWQNGNVLERMWNEEAYPDMCIIAQGEEIQCHRAVIAMASPVFDHMLSSDFLEGHRHQICFQDVAASVVRSAFGFIYTGRLPDCEDYDTICGLLDFANMYQLPCLANVCASRLLGSTEGANVRHILQLLRLHKKASHQMEDFLNKMVSKLKEDDVLLRALCFEGCWAVGKSQTERITTKAISVQTCMPAVVGASVPKLSSDLHVDADDLEAVSRKEASDAGTTFPSALVEIAVQTESVALFTHKPLDQNTAEVASHAAADEGLEANSNSRRPNKQRQLAACALSMVYASLADEHRTSQHVPSKVTLVGFNPFSKEFEEALLQSDLAQRLVTRGVDVKPPWAHGAKIFVDNVAKASLEQAGVQMGDLRRWHVLVLDEDMPLVKAIMRNLVGRTHKPRVRSARSVDLDWSLQDDLGNAEQIAGDGISCTYEVHVCRTFVHVPEPKMISPRTCYTQSSPDPHVENSVEIDRRRLNPRVWANSEP